MPLQTVLIHRNNVTTATGRILPFFSLCLSLFDIIYVMVAMFMVYKHIRDIEKKARSYTFNAFRTNERQYQAAERKRSRRVIIQGLMYAVAMLLVFIPLFVYFLCLIGGIPSFAMEVIVNLFHPLQGMYNAFIYSGKLQHWLYNHENQCRWQHCSCCSFFDVVTFSSFHSSVKRLFHSFIEKSVADNTNEGISGGKDEVVEGIQGDVICPGITKNAEKSDKESQEISYFDEVVEKQSSSDKKSLEISYFDAVVEKQSSSIYEDAIEEEEEESRAQFPINIPHCTAPPESSFTPTSNI